MELQFNLLHLKKNTTAKRNFIKLEQEIKIIENEVYTNFINMSDEILDNLETKLYDLQKIKCHWH